MVMGTSIASNAETTINTSTESASTLITGTDTSTCDSLDLGKTAARRQTPFFQSRKSLLYLVSKFPRKSHSQHAGDTTGQIEPLLSSFDEPAPLTAIPTNSIMLNRLDEEESVFFEDDETEAAADERRRQEDEDAKIPLLNADADQVRAGPN